MYSEAKFIDTFFYDSHTDTLKPFKMVDPDLEEMVGFIGALSIKRMYVTEWMGLRFVYDDNSSEYDTGTFTVHGFEEELQGKMLIMGATDIPEEFDTLPAGATLEKIRTWIKKVG